MKMAKFGHFCVLLDTPMPRRRSACLSVEIRLGEPEAEFSKFSDLPRRRNPRLGEPLRLGVVLLRLGQATPRPSYSSSFALSSVNSRICYSFVWTSNGIYLGIKLD